MNKTVEAIPETLQPETPSISFASALEEVEKKRNADVIRFRTCCADARASK